MGRGAAGWRRQAQGAAVGGLHRLRVRRLRIGTRHIRASCTRALGLRWRRRSRRDRPRLRGRSGRRSTRRRSRRRCRSSRRSSSLRPADNGSWTAGGRRRSCRGRRGGQPRLCRTGRNGLRCARRRAYGRRRRRARNRHRLQHSADGERDTWRRQTARRRHRGSRGKRRRRCAGRGPSTPGPNGQHQLGWRRCRVAHLDSHAGPIAQQLRDLRPGQFQTNVALWCADRDAAVLVARHRFALYPGADRRFGEVRRQRLLGDSRRTGRRLSGLCGRRGSGRRTGNRRRRLGRGRGGPVAHASSRDRISSSAIRSTSVAASEPGERVMSGIWLRIASATLRSRRTIPASGGVIRRNPSQALRRVS